MSSENDSFGHSDSVGRNITVTYLFAIASTVIGFLIVVVFSRLLSPDEWGAFSVVKRVATLTATVALLGVSVALTRYIPLERAKRARYADYYGTNALYIAFRTSATVVAIWMIGVYVFTGLGFIDEVLKIPLMAATVLIVALMWQLLLTSFLRAEGYILRFNQMAVGGQTLQLGIGLLAIVLLGSYATSAVVGAAAGIIVIVAVSRMLLERLKIKIYRKEYINSEVRSELLGYGLPRMAMGIFDVLIVSTSLILLGFSGLTAEAGFLAIGLQFVAMVALFFQPVAIVMLPEFSKLHGLESNDEIERKIQILLQGWAYLILPVVLLIGTFIEIIFPFIFKADYEPAIGLIKILLIGMIPYSFYLSTYSYINAIVKRPYLLYFLIVGVAVNIIIYIILVSGMGATGAALATVGGLIALGFMTTLLLLQYQRRAFSKIKIVDYIICSVPLLIIVALGFVSVKPYVHIGLSTVLLLLYLYLIKLRNLEWFSVLLKSFGKTGENYKGELR